MNTTGAAVGRAVFATMLAVFGVVLGWIGVEAVRAEHYVSSFTVSRGFGVGPVGLGEGGIFTDVFEGAAAQRIGAGFITFGLLLGVWALGIVANGPRELEERPGPFAWAAGTLYLAGLVLFYPPWLIVSSSDVAWFWGTALVWATAIALVVRHPPGRRTLAVVVPLFMVTLLAATVVPLRASANVLCGLAAGLGGAAHAAYVYPPWRRRMVRHAKAQAAADEAEAAKPTTAL